MKIAPPWQLIFRAPSLTRIHIEIRSPLRVKEHQSGFPQIRQGLRRLTRQKTFEADVGMARRCRPLCFSIDLSISGTIGDQYFFLRRSFCLSELLAGQINLVLSTDGGS